MLLITNDGRKLALDQRMIDPILPNEKISKVNVCVDNVFHIWKEHADTKAVHLMNWMRILKMLLQRYSI